MPLDIRNGYRLYHWKHGWIPLDHFAAMKKAKGNPRLAAKYLSDSAKAGHANPSFADTNTHAAGIGGNGAHFRGADGFQPVAREHLDRAKNIVAAFHKDTRNFHLLDVEKGRAVVLGQNEAEAIERGKGRILGIHEAGSAGHIVKVDFGSNGVQAVFVSPDNLKRKAAKVKKPKTPEAGPPKNLADLAKQGRITPEEGALAERLAKNGVDEPGIVRRLVEFREQQAAGGDLTRAVREGRISVREYDRRKAAAGAQARIGRKAPHLKQINEAGNLQEIAGAAGDVNAAYHRGDIGTGTRGDLMGLAGVREADVKANAQRKHDWYKRNIENATSEAQLAPLEGGIRQQHADGLITDGQRRELLDAVIAKRAELNKPAGTRAGAIKRADALIPGLREGQSPAQKRARIKQKVELDFEAGQRFAVLDAGGNLIVQGRRNARGEAELKRVAYAGKWEQLGDDHAIVPFGGPGQPRARLQAIREALTGEFPSMSKRPDAAKLPAKARKPRGKNVPDDTRAGAAIAAKVAGNRHQSPDPRDADPANLEAQRDHFNGGGSIADAPEVALWNYIQANPDRFDFTQTGEAKKAGAISPNYMVTDRKTGETWVAKGISPNYARNAGMKYAAQREVAAAKILEAAGVRHAPMKFGQHGSVHADTNAFILQRHYGEAVYGKKTPIKAGAANGLVHGADMGDRIAQGTDKTSLARMVLFDYLIDNQVDRHANNFMLAHPDNAGDRALDVVILDHGLGFGGWSDDSTYKGFEDWYGGYRAKDWGVARMLGKVHAGSKSDIAKALKGERNKFAAANPDDIRRSLVDSGVDPLRAEQLADAFRSRLEHLLDDANIAAMVNRLGKDGGF